jgi:hypothetical protein
MNASLPMWTIYASPLDHPGRFVVRRWLVAHTPVPDRTCEVYATLADARAAVPRGLVRMPRSPGDDPCIVGSWL